MNATSERFFESDMQQKSKDFYAEIRETSKTSMRNSRAIKNAGMMRKETNGEKKTTDARSYRKKQFSILVAKRKFN